MRVFFIECSGRHWNGIGQALSAKHGFVPVLWSGDAATIEAAAAAFPNIVGVNGVDAACGRMPAGQAWPRAAIGSDTLHALAPDETIALAMMDRMSPLSGAFDHDARRRHWHDLLRIWSGALDALKPDLVIFSIAPHAIYDYALYALCKYRNVPTRMFERTALPGPVYILERFEKGSEPLRQALAAVDEEAVLKLSSAAKHHLDGLRKGGEAALPANYRKKLAERGVLGGSGMQTGVGFLRTVGFELVRTAYLVLRRRSAPENYLVKVNRTGELQPAGLSTWLWNRYRGQWRKWRLSHLLKRLEGPLDTQQPYVLFALHYQPERAVVPMAGAFVDQTLIVDMLARLLPDGWKLIVKEHPWQLVPFGRGELSRSSAFYYRIASHKNIALVGGEFDTGSLLRSARAVVTATGSIGWQAIARGIPVFVFGAAWYRDAPGVHAINDVASCRLALESLRQQQQRPADTAERMLVAMNAASVAGYLEPRLEAIDGLKEEEAIANMSAALAQSMAVSTDIIPLKP